MTSNASDDPDGSIRVERQYGGETRPSTAIVRAIATIEDVDPLNSPGSLGVTLTDHFDPTALNRLVTETSAAATVTVDLAVRNGHRYSVQVRDTGTVVVERPSDG